MSANSPAPSVRPLIAGNWKMHGLRAQLAEAQTVRDALTAGEISHQMLQLCDDADRHHGEQASEDEPQVRKSR